MFVLCWLREESPRVVKFGPTSDRPDLLESFDAPWPSGAEVRAVLPVLPGVMLRVDSRDVDRAISWAET